MTSRSRNGSPWIPALLGVAVLLFALPLAVSGDEESENEAYLIAKGRVTFKVYCANCHGEQGVGDGPLAEFLRIPPADLTQITARHEGAFPKELVRQVIDGRQGVKGHGSREMPIWGDAFQKTLRPTWKELSDEERAEMKIDEVVAFLSSIQGDEE